jgi:hypothetical protein
MGLALERTTATLVGLSQTRSNDLQARLVSLAAATFSTGLVMSKRLQKEFSTRPVLEYLWV